MANTGYTAGNGKFAQDVAKWADGVNESLAEVVRGTMLELAARIRERTPVDTGRTKANWMASVDAPDTGTTDSTDCGAGERRAARAIARFDPLKHRSLYLTNSLPHVRGLEYGQGGKAPRGMVRVTVAEFSSIVREQVRLARARGLGVS